MPLSRLSRTTRRALLLTLIVSPFVLSRATADTASTVGDQGAEGSTAFTGLSHAPEANLFTGSMSTSIPILIPPGRPNATPELKLVYSSSNGPSPYGLGWDLPLGTIERSTKKGVPTCPLAGSPDNSEDFILNMQGASVELVRVENGIYRAKFDEGYIEARTEQMPPDGLQRTWIVRDRKGMVFRFGQSSDSRGFTTPLGPTTQSHDVFMEVSSCRFTSIWALTQIEDSNGNIIDITYNKTGGNILHPTQIAYGANPSAGLSEHPFRVVFMWAGSGAKPSASLRRGIVESQGMVLDRIDVHAKQAPGAEILVRAYDFTIAAEPGGQRVLLTSVEATDLPTQRFTYATSGLGLTDVIQTVGPTTQVRRVGADGSVKQTVMDMNGDGRIDMVVADAPSNEWIVHYGTEAGISGNGVEWTLPDPFPATDEMRHLYHHLNEPKADTQFDTRDIDGDGIADFIDATATPWRVYKGRCSGPTICEFLPPADWPSPQLNLETVQSYQHIYPHTHTFVIKDLLDVNGDGLLDLVVVDISSLTLDQLFDLTDEDYDDSGTTAGVLSWPWTVYLNDGSGFSPTPWEGFAGKGPISWTARAAGSIRSDVFLWVIDFNGDGLPDRVFNSSNWAGVDASGRFIANYHHQCGVPGWPSIPSGVYRAGSISVELNDGRGFRQPIYSGTPFVAHDSLQAQQRGVLQSPESCGSGCSQSEVDLLDVNGDGLPDWVYTSNSEAGWRVVLNRGDGSLEPLVVPSGPASCLSPTTSPSAQRLWPLDQPMAIRVEFDVNGERLTEREVVDWNGDGLLDNAFATAGNSWSIALSSRADGLAVTKPGLLIRADNGLGGVTHVRYAPSTAFAPADSEEPAPALPFVTWVTTAIRQTDGLCVPPAEQTSPTDPDPFDPSDNGCIPNGHETLQRFSYEGGLFDRNSHEFRGFRLVTVRDAYGNERVVEFSQADDTRGKVVKEQVFAGAASANNLVRQTMSVWQTRESLGRTQIFLAEQRTEDPPALAALTNPQPPAQCLVTRNEPPDDYGRVIRTCSLSCDSGTATAGQCSPGVLGQVQTDTSWATPQPGSHVYDRPSHVATVDYLQGGGTTAYARTLVSKDFYYDDGLALGEVARGNVREVRSSIGTTHIPIGGVASVFTTHDDFGNVTSVTDPNGHPTQYGFTGSPFTLYPTEVHAPATSSGSHISHRVTDLRFGKPSQTMDENGQSSVRMFDSLGRITCEAAPGDSCPTDPTVSYAYHYGDAEAELFEDKLSYVEVRRTDPNAPSPGYVASRTYVDALGRMRLETSQQVVGAAAGLSTVVSGQTEYDAQGRVLNVYASYEVSGPLEDPPIPETSPYPDARTTYSYVLNGNTPLGLRDPLGRPHLVTPPDGHATKTFFEGARTRVVDPGDDETWLLRDAFGREVRREERRGASPVEMSFSYVYDGLGRVVATTVSDNPATIVGQDYDRLGRVIGRFDPDSGDWIYGYDRAGNLVYENDPKPGQHVQMCYDAQNRLERTCTFSTTPPNEGVYVWNACSSSCTSTPTATIEATYTYDEPSGVNGKGRLTSVVDSSGSASFVYDERGRVVETTKVIQGLTATTAFEFDEGDHLLWTEYPDGEVVLNRYGAAGQLVGVEQYGGTIYVADIDYDKFGRVEKLAHGNGVGDELGYWDHAESFRLRELTTGRTASPTEHQSLEYTEYNELGKIQKIEDYRYTGPRSNEASFIYDSAGRLTNADGVAYDESYAYDSYGNAIQVGASVLEYNPGRPHQVAQRNGSLQVGYDDNGSVTYKQTATDALTNGYDRLGQLISSNFSGSGAWQTQKYDHTGRRVFRQESGGLTERYFSALFEFDGTNFTKYYFAGERLIAARWVNAPGFGAGAPPGLAVPPLRIPPELPAALGATALLLLLGLGRRERRLGIAVSASRALGASLLVVLATPPVSLLSVASARADCDEPLDLNLYHYHQDHLGSTQVLTDSAGAAYAHVRYTPYGRVRGRWDGAGTPIGADPSGLSREFTGYESDSVTGLQYAGARFYDPELGQFLSHDPASQFASPYAYGPGDPLNSIDPNGEVSYGLFDPIGSMGISFGELSYASGIEGVIAADFAGPVSPATVPISSPNVGALRDGSEVASTASAGTPLGVENALAGYGSAAAGAGSNAVLAAHGIGENSTTSGASASQGATIGPQEPAASLFGVIDLYSTTPISDTLFPNRGPLHFLVGAQEDLFVRALSGQLQEGEELSMVVPGGPQARLGVQAAARALAEKIGANAVRFRTPGSVGRIDLVGRSHFDKATGVRIPTPHVTTMERRVGPTGIQFGVPKTAVTRPATMQDIRNARRLSE